VASATPARVYLAHSNGAQGVIRVGNLAWERVEDVSREVEIGAELLTEIIEFNDERQQVELSRKAVLPKPYFEYKARHAIGDKVRAVVTRATATHVYLRHSNGATGVIYVSNLGWERVDNAEAFLAAGTEVHAEIIKFNDERQQVELSRKAVLPKPYPTFRQRHQIGDQVTGTVTKTVPSAAFVTLDKGAQGRIHVSQLANYRVNHPGDIVRKDQRVTATIVGFDDEKQLVQLSLKAPPAPSYPARAPSYPAATSVRPSIPVPPLPRPVTAQPAPARPVTRSVTMEAATVDDATEAACRQLGVPRSGARVEVLDYGRPKRLFQAAQPARVRVTTQ